MYKNFRILAVVLARGGSKGIKLKNLKKIKNKTLVGHVGNFCEKIKIIDQAVISTDHIKIGNEGKKNGLDFFFIRPKNLSKDIVSDDDVILHSLKKSEKYFKCKFDVIVSLPPTSPLRKKNTVIKAIKLLIDKKFDNVWSISKTDSKFHPLKQLKLDHDKLKFYNKNGVKIISRQQLNQVYFRNGSVYVINRNSFLRDKKIFNDNTGYVIDKSSQISIDTLEDIKLVKNYLKNTK
tara:strand:+ start:225 stop:929 length:705 start_codon:yes stop_codon:yes gene_type:complete